MASLYLRDYCAITPRTTARSCRSMTDAATDTMDFDHDTPLSPEAVAALEDDRARGPNAASVTPSPAPCHSAPHNPVKPLNPVNPVLPVAGGRTGA